MRLWGNPLRSPEMECLIGDINVGSAINIQDLILVAGKFGETGESAAVPRAQATHLLLRALAGRMSHSCSLTPINTGEP